jgi:hypothetical protein
MGRAFAEGRRVLKEDGMGCVVFAHKTTEGWEALLSGLVRGGWTITGSWPIATEMATRLRARESAALATASISSAARGPRTRRWAIGASCANCHGVLRLMERLETEGVAALTGFACIGPRSRSATVIRRSTPKNAKSTRRRSGGTGAAQTGYLVVWEVVGRTASTGARTDEARAGQRARRGLTALFLWTLQTTDAWRAALRAMMRATTPVRRRDDEAPRGKAKRGFSPVYDVARRRAATGHPPRRVGRAASSRLIKAWCACCGDRTCYPAIRRDGAEAVATGSSGRRARGRRGSPCSRKAKVKKAKGKKGKGQGRTVSDDALQARREATTLDRVHAAMLLQKAGRAQALRALLAEEQDRGPEFLRLANALSALYPRESEEKRLVDAMLVGMRR